MTPTRPIDGSAAALGTCPGPRLAGWLMAGCLALPGSAWAQASPDDAAQRERIALERRQADAELEQQRWECSRRFVVTSCLDKARSQHRDRVEALARAEELLDSRARQSRADRRLELIREKTEAFARLSPASATSPSQPATSLPDASQPSASSPQFEQRPAPRDKEPTAVDRAAARRAAASELRREDAARERAERATRRAADPQPIRSLPARPAIPPASPAASANGR